MKDKISLGAGILLLCTGAYFEATWLSGVAVVIIAISLFKLYGLTSGVQYTSSHYRIYKQYFFWKTGEWKSIAGVRKIYIRRSSYKDKHALQATEQEHLVAENQTYYQLYFVRKSGYYRIFTCESLALARTKANHIANQYNLVVEESKKLLQREKANFSNTTALQA